jgi:SAM-dependent methyltransferase
MEKMDDFQQYLDLVGDLIGPIASNEILLDAGCGNGLFGVWVTREMIRNKLAFGGSPPAYFGLDLTEGGLADAQGKHLAVQSMLRNGSHENGFNLNLLYARADVENFGDPESPEGRLLQFSNGCFDKIVCSLLLSYLKKPDKLLKQLHRVLRNRGRIVISSMKPFCDLSSIYRDFVHQEATQSDVESARELLRAAGAIKVKEEQGYYTFFSEEQLVSMLTQAGFQGVQCFASLGNQAFVAVGTK